MPHTVSTLMLPPMHIHHVHYETIVDLPRPTFYFYFSLVLLLTLQKVDQGRLSVLSLPFELQKMDVLVACCYLLVLYIVYRLADYLLYLPRISKRPESLHILVTGCDTGFGNAAAKRLDEMGCHVIAGCLTEAGEPDLRKSCSEKLKTIEMDVSKRESVQKAFEFVTNSLPSESGILHKR